MLEKNPLPEILIKKIRNPIKVTNNEVARVCFNIAPKKSPSKSQKHQTARNIVLHTLKNFSQIAIVFDIEETEDKDLALEFRAKKVEMIR